MLLERLVVELDANLSGLNKLSQADKRVAAFGRSVQNVGKKLSLGLTVPIVGLGVAATKMASTAEEAGNKFRTVFGPSAEAVSRELDGLRTVVPAARHELTSMAAGLQDLLKPLGVAPDEAAKMSVATLKLAADLASFNDVPVDEALAAIRSGMVGQSEPLLKFGADVRAAAVEAKALELGLIAEGEALDNAARATAVLAIVTDSNTDAIGDAARTAGSAANSFKFFWAALKDLGVTIGNVLLPVVTPMVQKLTDAVEVFNNLSPTTQKIIVAMAALAAAIGPVLTVVGGLVAILPALTAGWGLLVAAGGPITLGIVAFGALVAAGIALVENWGIIKYEVGRLVDGIREALVDRFTSIVDSVKASVDKVTGFFADLYEKVVGGSYIPELIEGIRREFARLDDVMVRPAEEAAAAVDQSFGGLFKSGFGSLKGGFLDRLGGIFDLRNIGSQLAGSFFGFMSSNIMAGLSTLFGPDPVEQERRRVIEANTKAVEALTGSLSSQEQLLRQTPGLELVGLRQAIDEDMFAPGGQIRLDVLRRALAELGLTMADLERIAKEYGIEWDNTAASLRALDAALESIDIAAIFAQFSAGFSLLQQQFQLLDITDPMERFNAVIDFLSGLVGEDLAAVLQGLTPENFDEFIAEVLERIRLGDLSFFESLGDITIDEFLQALGLAESALDGLADTADAVSGALRNVPTAFKVTLARFRASDPLGLDGGGRPEPPHVRPPRPGDGTPPVPPGARNREIVVNGDIIVQGVEDVPTLMTQLERAVKRRARTGTVVVKPTTRR